MNYLVYATNSLYSNLAKPLQGYLLETVIKQLFKILLLVHIVPVA